MDSICYPPVLCTHVDTIPSATEPFCSNHGEVYLIPKS